nr:CCA tRNA nucleotidyltransferase [Chitinophagales bacterium]
MKNTLIDPVVTICHEIAKKQSVKAYLVGGCVRDFIMNLEVDDIDIMVVGDALAFCQQVSEKLTSKVKVSIFKSFGTAHFHYENKNYEFVSARKESYQRESRNPIVSLGSFEEDIARRDFTINSLAMSLNETDYGTIIDLYQGIKHIEDKILQTPLDPNVSFNDDPLRMLRAVRFAGRFGFEISQESQASILSNAQRLEIIKKERIHTELNKMLLSEKPSTSLLMLDKLGLMPYVMPELLLLKGIEYREGFQHKDNFLHTLEVLDNVAKVSDKLYLRWAALLHDIAKPQTKRFEPNHGWTFHGHE